MELHKKDNGNFTTTISGCEVLFYQVTNDYGCKNEHLWSWKHSTTTTNEDVWSPHNYEVFDEMLDDAIYKLEEEEDE